MLKHQRNLYFMSRRIKPQKGRLGCFVLKRVVGRRSPESDVEQLVKFVRLITSRSVVRVYPSLFFLLPRPESLLQLVGVWDI